MSKQAYPSDLRDAEWRHLEPLIPPPKPVGRPRTIDIRTVVNAILFVVPRLSHKKGRICLPGVGSHQCLTV
jgi:transposase